MTQAEVEGSLLGRATRVASVFAKYGIRETRGSADPIEIRARRLRDALEELGPTFAKLGQILSTRPDLLPPEFIIELSSLQDDVAPLTEAEVVQVMEEELGVPWEDVFASIDSEPLAAGTIGQVHKATLDSGERVVVKVQRPGARDEIMRDLGLLRLFAEKTENREALRRIVDLPAVVEHLSNSLQRELTEYTEQVVGPKARPLAAQGNDPARVMVDLAKAEDIDVIVVGSVGMSGRKEFLLENVPNRVSHNAACTVVIVQTHLEGGKR